MEEDDKLLRQIAEREKNRQFAAQYVSSLDKDKRIAASHCSLCMERTYEGQFNFKFIDLDVVAEESKSVFEAFGTSKKSK